MTDISKKRKLLFGKGDLSVVDENSNRLYVQSIVRSEYATELPSHIQDKMESSSRSILDKLKRQKQDDTIEGPVASAISEIQDRKELVLSTVKKETPTELKPQKEHSKWKLMRVIAGHTGWVRSLTVEPENNWFASGAGDGTIKIWDMASGRLKLTLTGHIMAVRGLVVSERHPYMFSCSEDKTVKCWDLEKNKVVRDYHGHLSSVYAIGMHPSVDLLVTGGRDSSVRVWDIRTKNQIHCLTGHKQSVTQVGVRENKPEIVSTSMDSTVRLWDMAAGKSVKTLTHHSKAVRGLALHEGGFVTASAESIKSWDYNGEFVRDMANDGIVNTLSVNPAGVVFSGGDNGKIGFYDLQTGYKFQEMVTQSVPGSIESERGVLASVFDRSGMRLITGESDKSIKVWKEY